jgi:ribulose-5-phosphate 4-epimerase/fuculose-1-phosphate aldolase
MSAAFEHRDISVRERVSDAEWAVRVDLAALYRLVAQYGWDDLIFTHLSARVPGEEHHFLINPYGLMFDEITASSLVKIDLDGRKVMDTPYDVNAAGFTIHSAIHAAREDAHCVMHLHTDDGVAVSAQEHGLLALSQTAMTMLGDLAYHDYEGIALDLDERERLVADLGERHTMLLRNHGTLAVGQTCADAFLRMYFLERACTMQVRALSGAKSNPVHQGVPEKVAGQCETMFTRTNIPSLAWEALRRRLDREDPSYRD